MSRSYGYGQLKSQVNTLQSLLLTQSIPEPAVTPDLQAVLDVGSNAIDRGINLTNTGATSTSFMTPTNIETNNADGNSVTLDPSPQDGAFNTTSKLSSYTLQFDRETGIATRYKSDGIQTFNGRVLDITTDAGLTLQGLSSTDGQVVTADASGNPTWADLPVSEIPDLQAVLDEGNSANNIGIQLTSADRFEGNYTSTGINYVDTLNPNTTTLTNGGFSFTNGTITVQNTLYGFSSINTATGESYSLASNGLIVAGASGQQNIFNGDGGFIQIQDPSGRYLALSPNYININGSSGSESQILTKDATTNFPIWADLPVSQIPDLGEVLTSGAIANQAIDMSGNNINNVGNITALTETNLQGQFVFDTPPHVPDPILGNDAAPKGYVDSLVGQYAGGFNLFFNYSQTDVTYPTFQVLSPLISSSAGEIVPTTINTGTNFIAQFITEPIGIDTIPIGLWNAFVYGAINNVGGDAHYYFELWKKTALNVDTLLGTSGISPDINASPNNNPTSYSMVLTISTAIPLALTDRLFILIYVNYSGASSKDLSTYFEGNYYSFVQTSLNAGTTLLSSNNTWTGTNAFSLPPTTPNQVGTPANTDIVNYGTITDLIEPTVSIINYYITQTNPLFQYPPQPPSSTIITTYGYYGWQFINAVALRKIDWYFAPDYDMEVQDVLGLYMNYFNVASTSNDNLPFITIYTKPLGSGDIIPGFAHSSLTFIPNFTPVVNSPYCSFMNISGVQPTPFAYGHQVEPMIVSPVAPNPRGTYTPTMKVLAIAVGTNSTSPVNSVNFVMSKVGVCVASGNNESVLNPFNATQVGSWVGTATSQLNMGIYDISGAVMDNSGNTLTLGANTTTTTVGNASTGTTNLQGVVKINNSAGTSGQVLTSTGASTTPTWQAVPASSWVGTAASQLNMGIYDISGAVMDNSGNTLTLGANTTTTTVGNASTGTTNLQGVVKINNSAGSSGQVLTSTGASTTPTWQAVPASSWVGTATSQLNMGIYDISGAVMDNSGNTLTLGANTTTTTVGKASTGITNLQGVVKINNSAGSSGQVLTSTGASTTPTWQAVPASSWVGTATSQLNMGIYDISGAVMDNSGNTLTLGANTTTTTVGNASTGTTNLQGVVKINNSAGTSGQVLTSTGASTTPTWQTPAAGSASLAVVKTNPTLLTQAYAPGAFRTVFQNNFLNVTPPSVTATYLIQCQLLCNNQTANTAFFGNVGYQVGGGAQTTAALSLFNNLAMSNAANTTFNQTNSLSQCNLSVDNTFNQLSFTYIHTPGTLSQVSYAFWLGSSAGNGAATIFSMSVIRIIS